MITQRVVDFMITEEIGSRSDYEGIYTHPNFPGGESGITIGIGYDLGYTSAAQIAIDWKLRVPDTVIRQLVRVCNLKGTEAKKALTAQLRLISIPYHAAELVFSERTLPHYAAMAVRAFPGLTELLPDAAGAILSLVYNRGTRLKDVGPKEAKERAREEMRKIAAAIPSKDYASISDALISMQRLWDGIPDFPGDVEQKFSGLVKRRAGEAALVRGAQRQYAGTELKAINF